MKQIILLCFFTVFFKLTIVAQLSVVSFTTGQTGLVDIASCGDDRLFLVKKTGVIVSFDSAGIQNPVSFLDIRGRVNSTGLEKGMLGLVFAPDFLKSGIFYVYYVALPGVDTRISRFRVSTNPDVADSTSEQIIITIPQPVGSHFGGDLAFGKDNYLYLGLGDGGGEGDPSNHAQDTSLLLGKFLRLDVSDTSLAGYSIPPDNPFLSSPFRDEVWSVGFRNPWRWSFDRMTGDMWIGDVGQVTKEEIDFQHSYSHGGENYGWRCYEGTSSYVTTNCSPQTEYVDPLYEYPHGSGCSVTGGFVYRGSRYNTMFGNYFYSDWCNNSLRMLSKNGNVYTDTSFAFNFASGPVCFGEDRWGDLYIGLYNGTVFRIEDSTAHHVAWISDSDSLLFCDGSAVLQTPPGPGFHFEWNYNGNIIGGDTSALDVNQAGNYFVTVEDSNGLPQVSGSVYVSFNSLPAVSINGLDTFFCTSASAVPILVSPIGGKLRIDGIVKTVFQFNPADYNIGLHLVDYTYTNSSGCTNVFHQQIRVDACSFIGEETNVFPILYPVPSKNYLRVNSIEEFLFYDVRGNLLNLSIDRYNDHCIVHTENLPPGFYFCRINSQSGTKVLKWLKN